MALKIEFSWGQFLTRIALRGPIRLMWFRTQRSLYADVGPLHLDLTW